MPVWGKPVRKRLEENHDLRPMRLDSSSRAILAIAGKKRSACIQGETWLPEEIGIPQCISLGEGVWVQEQLPQSLVAKIIAGGGNQEAQGTACEWTF